MTLENDQQLANTRRKLRMLEEDYEVVGSDSAEDEEVRELTMESLQRLINQLKEEIAWYEAHQAARR